MSDSQLASSFPAFAASDVKATVDGLRDVFRSGRTKDLDWRERQLRGLMKMATERVADIEAALKADMRKCRLESTVEITSFWTDVNIALRNFRKWAAVKWEPTIPFMLFAQASVVQQPLGVVLIISPWNFPFMLSLCPLASALAAGNCVVIKPSELSPVCSQLIADLCSEYLDKDAVKVVQGDAVVGQALLDCQWDHIFFTGSGNVGRIVMQSATRFLTPVTMELGGKNPVYIDHTVNLFVSARRFIFTKTHNLGQACLSPDYMLVPEHLMDEVIDQMIRVLKIFFPGDPLQNPDFSRIITRRHTERLQKMLEHPATADCIVYGGEVDLEERFVAPTLLRNVPWDAPIMQEETFGPMLCIQAVSGPDEAIRIINQRPKPLSLYVFSHDSQTIKRFKEETASGHLIFLEASVFMMNHNIPFGGVGESGFGKCHGKFGFDTFSYHRGMMTNPIEVDPMIRYPPWTEDSVLAYIAFITRSLAIVYYFLEIVFDMRSYFSGRRR